MVLSLGLVAAACGKKDDGDTTNTTTGGTEETEAPSGDTEVTAPAETTRCRHDTATTPAAPEVTPGGEIVVSGEAEVANPWTPAAMQCDSYCQQRARSFYDPLAAIGADLKVHGVLAETITPERRLHRVDDQGPRAASRSPTAHPVDADAVIENLQRYRDGLLISRTRLVDLAKVPSDADPTRTTSEDRDSSTT